MESLVEYILFGICMILIILPPKYDPAIQFKEFLDEQRRLYEEEKARLKLFMKDKDHE